MLSFSGIGLIIRAAVFRKRRRFFELEFSVILGYLANL